MIFYRDLRPFDQPEMEETVMAIEELKKKLRPGAWLCYWANRHAGFLESVPEYQQEKEPWHGNRKYCPN